ncbi:hypothetical protein [Brevundimonas nasdae]|uniref:hypothetical protein n=1 Tax=Brevundimonas nasdae TaxID=172043 RepID=UPI003F68EF64
MIPARPEGDWTWRRAFVYGGRIGLLLLVAYALRLAPPSAINGIATGLIIWGMVESAFYLIAPSATEIIRFVAELRPRLPFTRDKDASR